MKIRSVREKELKTNEARRGYYRREILKIYSAK
jgi:hypothetical protein